MITIELTTTNVKYCRIMVNMVKNNVEIINDAKKISMSTTRQK